MKPTDVKIIQIFVLQKQTTSNPTIYGLGSDEKVYEYGAGHWTLA